MPTIVGLGDLNKQSPMANLDLDKKLAKEVKGYRPGSVLKVVLIGAIESMSFNKPGDPDVSGFEGYVRLKIQKAEIMESARNQMAELLDDDE